MTHQTEPNSIDMALQLLAENGQSELSEAVRIILNEAMRLERSQVLRAAPYERTDQRLGHANGFKAKTVDTRLGEMELKVPQVRGGVEFYPSALEKGLRSERALKLAIAEMYVQGVSTRKVAAIMQQMCGLDVTSTQVSRASAELDRELEKWRQRPLGRYAYLFLDARYEKVRQNGNVISCAVLIAIGVDSHGRRSVLGVSSKLSEAELHWRDFLTHLQERGLHGVELIVSDDHAGLKAARTARFSGVPWQRCQFHFQQNAQAYVPKVEQRTQVGSDLRSVFNAQDRQEAEAKAKKVIEKWTKPAPKLAAWLEENLTEALTVFAFPESHRRRLRTTNAVERINMELKRRTRVAMLFPNEKSLERLVTALLMEVSEEWELGKIYLNMKTLAL